MFGTTKRAQLKTLALLNRAYSDVQKHKRASRSSLNGPEPAATRASGGGDGGDRCSAGGGGEF